jgi:hypothetical protein
MSVRKDVRDLFTARGHVCIPSCGRGAVMWKTVCQQCKWTSGEAYLQSVAEAIGKLHEEDNVGHKVAMKEVSTFGRGLDEKDDPERHGPGPSKS